MNKWWWVVFSVVFFQGNDILLRILSSKANFVAGTIVQTIPLALVCGIAIYKSRDKVEFKKTSIKFMVLYGALQFLLGNMLYFTAMKYGGLSVASPTVQSQAIWAVILGMLFLKEKVSPVMWGGISMFALGIAGLAFFKSSGTQMQSGWLFGAVLGIFGGLSWASGSATQRKALNEGANIMHILFFGALSGVILLLAFGFISMGKGFAGEFLKLDTYKMLSVGVFSGAATWCVSEALKRIPISKVIPVLSVNIIFNTLTGSIFFHEYISIGTFTSMFIVVLGIVIVNEPFKVQKENKQYKEELY